MLIMLSICTISGKEAAVFKHHSGPITSVEWHPLDSTVFASAGADDQVSLFHHVLPLSDKFDCFRLFSGI